MKSNQIIAVFVLLLIVAIGSFFVGTKYQQKQSISNFREQMIGNRQGQGMGRNTQNGDTTKNRGQMVGFRQTVGEIISVDDKSITIKMTDGSSKIVLVSDSTKINQSTTATKTDLKIGTKIMVNGDTNTDGSISSRNIEINPTFASLTITPAPKQ